MTVYKGFSTILNKKRYSLTDYALARQDLINYFNIRKGSKLMQPGFGTIIWTQLFEPLSETTQDIITNDIKKIVGYDPRLSITDIAVAQQSNGIQISISLTYIPTNQVDTIEMNFNKTNSTLTTN
jgi:phage baseplate assembly protein W